MAHLLQILVMLSPTSWSFLPGEHLKFSPSHLKFFTFSEIWSPPQKPLPPLNFLQNFQASFIVWLFLAKLKPPMRRDMMPHIFVPHRCAAQSWPGQLRWIQVASILPWLSSVMWPWPPAVLLWASVSFLCSSLEEWMGFWSRGSFRLWDLGVLCGSLLQEVLSDVLQLLQGLLMDFCVATTVVKLRSHCGWDGDVCIWTCHDGAKLAWRPCYARHRISAWAFWRGRFSISIPQHCNCLGATQLCPPVSTVKSPFRLTADNTSKPQISYWLFSFMAMQGFPSCFPPCD